MTLRLRLLFVAVVGLVFAGLAPNALAAAKVRVLHSAPDVPAVTVYVNGAAAIQSLGPLQSTDYLDLPAGTYKVAVALAGQPESAAVLRTDLTVADNKRYTAFATGLLADASVKLGAIEDVYRAPFSRSSVRVWHNSPDAPAVDVLVNGQTVLTNVPYGATSQYLPLPAGTYDVRVNVAGTSTTVFSSPISLARGESYTAVAMGSVAGTGEPFQVKVLRDATSGALLRVLHASPNVPAVTVYVNGQQAIKRVGTLKATGYLALDAGTYDVAVAAAGQPLSKAVLKAKITLGDKSRYTALARGLAGAKKNKLELALQNDIATAPRGKAGGPCLAPLARRPEGRHLGQRQEDPVGRRLQAGLELPEPGRRDVPHPGGRRGHEERSCSMPGSRCRRTAPTRSPPWAPPPARARSSPPRFSPTRRRHSLLRPSSAAPEGAADALAGARTQAFAVLRGASGGGSIASSAGKKIDSWPSSQRTRNRSCPGSPRTSRISAVRGESPTACPVMTISSPTSRRLSLNRLVHLFLRSLHLFHESGVSGDRDARRCRGPPGPPRRGRRRAARSAGRSPRLR